MTAAQFKKAFKLAQSDSDINADDSNLYGFGCSDFKPAITTIAAVAKTIRWQCATFAGTWDMKEAQAIKELGRKRFIIVDSD